MTRATRTIVATLAVNHKSDDWQHYPSVNRLWSAKAGEAEYDDQRIMATGGIERVLSGTLVDKLASELQGHLIAIGDSDYGTVRKVWNGTALPGSPAPYSSGRVRLALTAISKRIDAGDPEREG